VALPLRVSKLACIVLFASPPHLLPREPANYFATAGMWSGSRVVERLGGVDAEGSALSCNHTYQLLHTSDLRDLSVRREASLRLVMSTLCRVAAWDCTSWLAAQVRDVHKIRMWCMLRLRHGTCKIRMQCILLLRHGTCKFSTFVMCSLKNMWYV